MPVCHQNFGVNDAPPRPLLTTHITHQISDLLAQISGGPAKGPNTSGLDRANTVPTKRKADSDLGTSAPKASRVTPPTPRPAADRPSSTIKRTQNGAITKPGAAASRPSSSAKPAAPAPAAAAAKPPKKGSFAEILARGQRAQATMGQVGRIQHKKVEGMPKKTKEDARPLPKPAKKGSTGYAGTAKPGLQRSGTNGSSPQRNEGRGPAAAAAAVRKPTSSSSSKKRPEPEPEKKIKKAAAATTGYTGTARPKAGDISSKRSDAPRGGALLNVPTHRPGARKSRYDEEEDEDMDDFIEYDEDEDEQGYGGGPRYDYASDASSDMEAGMDEVYDEEQRAARIAQREDMEQERMEMSLKAAKEKRKREALEALRANRR